MCRLIALFMAVFMALTPALRAQTTEQQLEPGVSPYFPLGKNLLWGTAGPGGVENVYIFQMSRSDGGGFCVGILNNANAAKSATITAYVALDPSEPNYLLNAGHWLLASTATLTGAIPANAAAGAFFDVGAYPKVALKINTTGASDGTTASFFISKAPTGTSAAGNNRTLCTNPGKVPTAVSMSTVSSQFGAAVYGALAGVPTAGALVTSTCGPASGSNSAVMPIATAGSATIGPALTVQSWRTFCAITGSISADGTIQIIDYSGASCGAGIAANLTGAIPLKAAQGIISLTGISSQSAANTTCIVVTGGTFTGYASWGAY